MSSIDNDLWCKSCGVEFSWSPYIINNFKFCCEDCHHGYKCNCGERMELNDNHRSENKGWLEL